MEALLVSLTDKQLRAAKSVANWFHDKTKDEFSYYYLAGYAGTGKSTVLPDIIDMCNLEPTEVAFCAPTGKAARVMTSKLKSQFPNVDAARTIHSLIYLPRPETPDIIERTIDKIQAEIDFEMDKAYQGGSTDLAKVDRLRKDIKIKEQELEAALLEEDKPRFSLNLESNVRFKRLIIVDEASMVGENIADDLLAFGIPVLAIGDPAQLPPVGDTPGFTSREPDFFLDEIHRQALDNPIIRLTMDIREGKRIVPCTMGSEVHIVTRKNDTWTSNTDYDAMVICGTHRKRYRLTSKIRQAMGYDSTGPMEGEPLIVSRNSRRNPDLVNGSFVTCLSDVGDLISGRDRLGIRVRDREANREYSLRCVQEYFETHLTKGKDSGSVDKRSIYKAKKECEHLDFGWAITCHKSQGSQWENVIVHDESDVFRDDSSRWLYTAATRASEELVIVV